MTLNKREVAEKLVDKLNFTFLTKNQVRLDDKNYYLSQLYRAFPNKELVGTKLSPILAMEAEEKTLFFKEVGEHIVNVLHAEKQNRVNNLLNPEDIHPPKLEDLQQYCPVRQCRRVRLRVPENGSPRPQQAGHCSHRARARIRA